MAFDLLEKERKIAGVDLVAAARNGDEALAGNGFPEGFAMRRR